MSRQCLHLYDSPLGKLLLTANGSALTGLCFVTCTDERPMSLDLPVFRAADQWLDRYFEGLDPAEPPPLEPHGTPFRLAVWELLCGIPYGHTVTYGQLAAKLTYPRMSPQAVGGAVGHNPIALMIPCHRVLGAGGSLTGYRYGLNVKAALLRLEQII